jgi:hypothetical protein
MRISATFNVTFQILDKDLFDQLDENEYAWTKFLTAVLDSVRYSEDWTKRLVSVQGDELYWDEEHEIGEAQMDVTIDIHFGDDLEWYTNWASNMKDSWDVDLPEDPAEFEGVHFLNLVMPPNKDPYRHAGPFWFIVRYGTLIPKYNNGEGVFLAYESEEQDMYLEHVRNMEDRMYFSFGEFTDIQGNDFDVSGDTKFENFVVEPA